MRYILRGEPTGTTGINLTDLSVRSAMIRGKKVDVRAHNKTDGLTSKMASPFRSAETFTFG